MLLNPKKETEHRQAPVKGSIEAMDPFDHPIPGQSLTEEPGKHTFEKPPSIVEIDDAIAYVVQRIEGTPDVKQEFIKQMVSGMPIESIVNTIALSGFAEGMWSPDIAEIIKLPLASYFMLVAEDANINATLFNSVEEEGMSDETMLSNMKKGNPQAFEALVTSLQPPSGEGVENQLASEGFLDVAPDEQFIEEEGGMV